MINEFGLRYLKDISKRIEAIFEICEANGGITQALNDDKFCEPAIIFHLIICKEDIDKIVYDGGSLKDIFSQKDIIGLKAIKNATKPDFKDISLAVVEKIINYYLTPLKQKIDAYINSI